MVCCIRRRKYGGNRKEHNYTKYRTSSYHNDKRNSRGDKGLSLPRRTCTKRPVDFVDLCSFFFVASLNDKVFFILNKYGNHTHCNDHSIVPIS